MRRKRFESALVLGLVLLLLSGCSGKAGSAWKEHDEDGVTMQLPKDWKTGSATVNTGKLVHYALAPRTDEKDWVARIEAGGFKREGTGIEWYWGDTSPESSEQLLNQFKGMGSYIEVDYPANSAWAVRLGATESHDGLVTAVTKDRTRALGMIVHVESESEGSKVEEILASLVID